MQIKVFMITRDSIILDVCVENQNVPQLKF